jgi:hypothetical protein
MDNKPMGSIADKYRKALTSEVPSEMPAENLMVNVEKLPDGRFIINNEVFTSFDELVENLRMQFGEPEMMAEEQSPFPKAETETDMGIEPQEDQIV